MPSSTVRLTPKERRQEQHIEEGYERRGVSEKEAKRRAWATVNKRSDGTKAPPRNAGKT